MAWVVVSIVVAGEGSTAAEEKHIEDGVVEERHTGAGVVVESTVVVGTWVVERTGGAVVAESTAEGGVVEGNIVVVVVEHTEDGAVEERDTAREERIEGIVGAGFGLVGIGERPAVGRLLRVESKEWAMLQQQQRRLETLASQRRPSWLIGT